jgi:hypothetical protein
VNHLAVCQNQPEHVRACALSDSACTLSQARTQQTSPPPNLMEIRAPESALPAHLQQFTSMSLPPHRNSMGPTDLEILSPLPDSIGLSSTFPSPASFSSHLRPEDSISAVSSSSQTPILVPSSSSLSRRPSSCSGLARSASGSLGGPGWTKARQELFENILARLTVSANLPLSWVDNTVWQTFCDEFLPAAKSPS